MPTDAMVLGTKTRLTPGRAGLLPAWPVPCADCRRGPLCPEGTQHRERNRAGFQPSCTPSQMLLCSTQHVQLCSAAR